MLPASAPVAAFETLWELLPTPALLLAPVYGAPAAVVDFTCPLANPAARQWLGTVDPTVWLSQLPAAAEGLPQLLAHCVPAFGSGERTSFPLTLPGLAAYQVTVQRTGEWLVVLFGPPTAQPAKPARRPEPEPWELMTTVFEQAPAGVWVVRGPEYVFELCNPQMGEVLGCTPAQALGRPYFEVMPELVSQGIPELLRQVWEGGEPVVIAEYRAQLARHVPGEQGYFTFTFQPLRDARGQVNRISCVALDVTAQVVARQQAEQLARELEQRVWERTRALASAQAEAERQRGELQRILEQAPVAVAIFRGPQHIIELANELHLALWGRTAAQVLDRPLFEALPEAAGQGYEELLAGVLTTGQPFVAHELSAALWRRGQLEQVYFNFVYQPLREADGQITGVVVVAIDLTEQVQARHQVEALNRELEQRVAERTQHVQVLNAELQAANQELQASNAQLTRINADLDTFVYTASHDLKSPITNVDGLLSVLVEELPAGVRQQSAIAHVLSLIHAAIERFQRTLSHLTTLVQPTGELVREPVPLAALIEDVRLDLAPVFAATQGQLQVDVVACPTLLGSPKDLRSIVLNLVSNALKYHQPGRPPVVRVQARSGAAALFELTVQDNGLGLSEQQQQQVFQLFRRLHPEVEGAGVGLYAIRKLVENAGGTITLASEPGVGSTFTVRLPQ
jgi:PAS domain S-box-containing protein